MATSSWRKRLSYWWHVTRRTPSPSRRRWQLAGLVVVAAASALLVAASIQDSPAPTTSAVEPPPERAMFLGGSLVEGVGASDRQHSFPYRVAEMMGWRVGVEGEADTGYATASQAADSDPLAQPFWARVGEVVAADPDVVVVQGGRADAAEGAVAQSRAEVRRTLEALREGLPTADLVVVGPMSPDGRTTPELERMRDIVRATASEVGATFVDPLAEQWLTPERAEEYLDPATGALDDAGHQYVAEQLVEALGG